MTTDPYMDAIRAGAAALAKPYTREDTVRAFADEFPTLAAARVIEAALPYMRATMHAETVDPGPCPAVEPIPASSPNGPQNLHALCDLRAGHRGQHETASDEHGYFRWSGEEGVRKGCTNVLRSEGHLICVRVSGHIGYHVAETLVWNDGGTVVAR